MNKIQPFLPQSSPFDAIRRVRPDGSEYWLARELMVPLGYMRWDGFLPAIERATITAQNSGVDVPSAFAQVVKVRRDPKLGDQQRYDYELSRFACYLTAMNGDPRKSEIAAAQTYFALRTREAETRLAIEVPRSFAEALELAARQARALEEAEGRAEIAEHQLHEIGPAAKSWGALADAHGDYSLRDAAQILSRDPLITIGQNQLMLYLKSIGWVDPKGEPYQHHVKAGRLVRRATSYDHPHTGEPKLSYQVRITPKGLAELHKHLGGFGDVANVVAA